MRVDAVSTRQENSVSHTVLSTATSLQINHQRILTPSSSHHKLELVNSLSQRAPNLNRMSNARQRGRTPSV